MNSHPPTTNRHPGGAQLWASPRNQRIGALVLVLIMVNQINDPLTEATLGEAFLFWVLRPLILAAGLLLADRLVAARYRNVMNHPAWLKPVVLVTAIGLVPFAFAEAFLELQLRFRPEFLDDDLWNISPALALLGEYATSASIVVPLHFVLWLAIDKPATLTDEVAADAAAETPAFLELASSVSATDVLALQADEHYVRIFTTEGAELINYRFGNAVDEMPAELGLQVHRSWWVADSAVVSAKRGARRWQLGLNVDIEVPVSDSYVASVRERGWLKKKSKKSATVVSA